MKQVVPIYLANIEVVYFNTLTKKERKIEDKILEKTLVKTFSIFDLKDRLCFRRVKKKILDKVKLERNEEFRIKSIELLIQLGRGVDE